MLEEVYRAIKRISNDRAAGIDGVSIELVKNGGKYTVKTIHKLCCLIWNTGKWPRDWCKAVYIPILKEGDLQRYENYRTIFLISHISKILLIVIAERIKQKLETEIADVPAEFRKGRGTRDQIFNLRQLMEKSRESNFPLYMYCIDYMKAFDCVHINKLWNYLKEFGLLPHLIGLMETLDANKNLV